MVYSMKCSSSGGGGIKFLNMAMKEWKLVKVCFVYQYIVMNLYISTYVIYMYICTNLLLYSYLCYSFACMHMDIILLDFIINLLLVYKDFEKVSMVMMTAEP